MDIDIKEGEKSTRVLTPYPFEDINDKTGYNPINDKISHLDSDPEFDEISKKIENLIDFKTDIYNKISDLQNEIDGDNKNNGNCICHFIVFAIIFLLVGFIVNYQQFNSNINLLDENVKYNISVLQGNIADNIAFRNNIKIIMEDINILINDINISINDLYEMHDDLFKQNFILIFILAISIVIYIYYINNEIKDIRKKLKNA